MQAGAHVVQHNPQMPMPFQDPIASCLAHSLARVALISPQRMAVVVMDASVKPFWALMGFQPKQATLGGPGCYVTAHTSSQCARNAGPCEVWFAPLEQVAKEAAGATAMAGAGARSAAELAAGSARSSRRGAAATTAAAAVTAGLTGVAAAKQVVSDCSNFT